MVIKVVIGSNFGDEGKGLMTDYFCHQSTLRGEKCLVVLHNGGAQRGHTVVTPDGKRHVFQHFGSGTFVGADTYLSEKFILNPMIFRQEWEVLEKMGISPMVYVHPLCRVTTPYDMIANQIIESSRGSNKHGSCGIGIFETIKRYKDRDLFAVWQLQSPEFVSMMLKDTREYYQTKLGSKGINVTEEWRKIIDSIGLTEHFANDLKFMFDHINLASWYDMDGYEQIIFEGGQGLLLDQNNSEYFPHLTPSNTGIKNPLESITQISGIFPSLQISDIEICYVTRTYLTRHGAGRLDGECDKAEINPNMQDLTNVPNPHQGTLRYGKMDVEALIERVENDFKPMRRYDAKISLAITHTNESNAFSLDDVEGRGFHRIYTSNDETRDSVKKLNIFDEEKKYE